MQINQRYLIAILNKFNIYQFYSYYYILTKNIYIK